MANGNDNKALENEEASRQKSEIDNPFVPTEEHRETIYRLGKAGMALHDAAFFIKDTKGKPVSKVTVRKYLFDDYERGRLDMHHQVGARMVERAMQGKKMDMVGFMAASHISKTRMGWNEKQQLELSGPDGGPIEHEHTLTESDALRDAAEILKGLAEAKAGGHIRKTPVAEDSEA